MSLWTPYADGPLDLTVQKTGTSSVKYGQEFPPALYLGFYQEPLYVSSAQISPESGGSTCSGYEASVFPRKVSTTLQMEDCDDEVLSDDPDFQEFERHAIRAMAEKNGGSLPGNNPRMRRAVQSSQVADDSYRKQRERNNLAAKQSRDRRKLREIHLALKVTFLKNKMAKMKALVAAKTCNACRRLDYGD